MKITFVGVWMTPDVGETTSFVIDLDSGERVLVDCGTNLVGGLLKAGIEPSSITHVIVTHTHGDHISGLPTFLFYRFMYLPAFTDKGLKPIKIVATEKTIEDVQKYIDIPYGMLTHHPSLEYLSCNTESTFAIGSASFDFFYSKHNPQTVGFTCKSSEKSFVYSSDSAFDESIVARAENADLLIHDVAATHEFELLSGGHTLCAQISPVLEKYSIKKFVPIHRLAKFSTDLTPYVDELKADYTGGIIIPEDGMTISV